MLAIEDLARTTQDTTLDIQKAFVDLQVFCLSKMRGISLYNNLEEGLIYYRQMILLRKFIGGYLRQIHRPTIKRRLMSGTRGQESGLLKAKNLLSGEPNPIPFSGSMENPGPARVF